jgi:hypothetical protein
MYLISLAGFAGSLFISLFLLHINVGTTVLSPRTIVMVYVLTFGVSGLLYSGSAFTGFRSKEKSIVYLMNPASRLEKFLSEYISRILVFFLVVPVVFWVVYNAETGILSMLHHRFTYSYHPFFVIPEHVQGPDADNFYLMILSVAFLLLTLPFTGASIFNRHPLIKTLFSVSIIFFFHLFLVYFFVEVLNFKMYNISPHEVQLYILPTSAENAIRLFTTVSIVSCLLLTSIAFFKLKEKEV